MDRGYCQGDVLYFTNLDSNIFPNSKNTKRYDVAGNLGGKGEVLSKKAGRVGGKELFGLRAV